MLCEEDEKLLRYTRIHANKVCIFYPPKIHSSPMIWETLILLTHDISICARNQNFFLLERRSLKSYDKPKNGAGVDSAL